jgi:hypothetical protein
MGRARVGNYSFLDDLRAVLAEVRLHPHLGQDLNPVLVQVLSGPRGDSLKKAVLLLDEEYTRLGLSRGRHSLARLRTLTDWLTTVELKALCGGLQGKVEVAEEEETEVE